ncbi:MAG: hypothetical protein HYS83_02425 [Candidatus Blackburnbacteria bacterium]|nr:hypothetical protein [Candidatus Blackburnbacteria bacterium]
MQIIKPPDFLSVVNSKHVLLDTTVFIDAMLHPAEFANFFNELKDSEVTLVTLEVVVMEFVKGAANDIKFKEKKRLVDGIVEAYLPITHQTNNYGMALVQKYREYGKALSNVDFLLGATLVNYSNTLLLMTRDCTDFPSNIFTLRSCFNVLYPRGLHVYGVYTYKS